MRLLLETHALIWWLAREPLSKEAEAAIAAPENEILVSAASVWEAEIKVAAGRLHLSGELIDGIEESRFAELPVRSDHGRAAARLPLHHRDPFDRMLIAQARLEGLTLVSRDPTVPLYDVPVLKA